MYSITEKKARFYGYFLNHKIKKVREQLKIIMKVTAVICEYNPFHKGHLIQLEHIKGKGDLVVCIMSGSFVQRGQPALFDKYARAKAAVLSGADLVLELPYPYCCSAAEHFCFGGVSIADSLSVVDDLCFGSECGDIGLLKKVRDRVCSDEFSAELKKCRTDRENKQKPYAVLREELYGRMFGEQYPSSPNDILGVGYLSAIKRINSSIEPVTYKREEGHSASEARRLLIEKNSFGSIPDNAVDVFAYSHRFDMKNAQRAIIWYYRNIEIKQLKQFEEMTDGIAERMKKSAEISRSIEEFIDNIKGKSYTNAKIRRCIINGMNGVKKQMLINRPLYTQVLAFNENGRKLIKRIQTEGDISLLSKPGHYKKLGDEARKQAEFSNSADILLTLMCEEVLSAGYFLKQGPYIHK